MYWGIFLYGCNFLVNKTKFFYVKHNMLMTELVYHTKKNIYVSGSPKLKIVVAI